MGPRHSKIVVGIDGSDASIDALRWAIAPNGTGDAVCPVMAWQYPTPPFLPAPIAGPDVLSAEEMQQAAEQSMATALSLAAEGGEYLDPVVRMGQPETVLLDVAAGASLLVVGCRGLGRIKQAFLGSTSRHVVEHATIPVAVVPDTDDAVDRSAPRRIVVGIDHSDHAAHALEWALRWARPEDEISALGAWRIPVGFGYDIPQFDRQHLRASALQTVHSAISAAGANDRVVATIAEGDPRTVLAHAAADADLLVVGARGRTGLAHLALGSTTTALLTDPQRPIVVVP